MRVRALVLALSLLAAFGGARFASGGAALDDWAEDTALAAQALSPVGGAEGARAAGRGAANATAATETALPARVVNYTPTSNTIRTFPTTDYTDPTAGPRAAETDWRVVGSTGNAAELWIAITRTGRILDLGGRYVIFSDDQGLTWKAVKPQEELVNAEGSVIQAPNGDIVGITWDPYSGDRVLTYKYNAADGYWYYMYLPLHTPFWDRPSIEVVPGNFTDRLGNKVPYITFTNGFPHDPWQFSYDGLNYTEVSSPQRDRGPAIRSWLDVKPDPMFDYIQPTVSLDQGLIPKFTPLGDGNAWYQNLLFTASDMKWHPWTTPDGDTIAGALQVDSRGWLHNVVRQGNGFEYRISPDGGRTWNSTLVEGAAPGDFKANAEAGVAAVWGITRTQDLVYKLDISTAQPRLIRRYVVGLGDDCRCQGVGFYGVQGGHRFDFSSIGVLPDGRVAVSFMDSKTKMPFPTLGLDVVAPQMAIEVATRPPGG